MIPVEKIMEFLPHRYPFLLVDRVLELEPAKSITAVKNVTCNEAFFQGHFPEKKIMPGVLIVEAIAQAGGVLLFNSIEDAGSKFAVLSKIEDCRFKRMVTPGDQLRIEVQWVRMKGPVCHMSGKALVDGEVAVEGEIYATLLQRSEVLAKG